MRPLLPILAVALALAPSCAPGPDLAPAATHPVTVIDERDLVDLLTPEEPDLLVVNLFATWCSACRGELPVLDRLAREETGLAFAAVSLDEAGTTEAVRTYASSLGLTLPVYHLSVADPISTVERHLEPFRGAIPITAALGPGGEVLAAHLGRASRDDLDRLVGEARARADVASAGVAAVPR